MGRAVCFLEGGIPLSSKHCLVVTAVEQHVTIAFKTEISLCIETLKESKITMLPQLKILIHLPAAHCAMTGREQQTQGSLHVTQDVSLMESCQNKCSTKNVNFDESAFQLK